MGMYNTSKFLQLKKKTFVLARIPLPNGNKKENKKIKVSKKNQIRRKRVKIGE